MDPLSLLNLVITICLVIGGVAAYRHGFTRTANEVQERVINALQNEIHALQDRITALERENTRLSHTITTMCSALKQRGIHVTIDGDIVSIQDRTGNSYIYNTRAYSLREEQDIFAQEEEQTSERASTPVTKKRSRKRANSVASQIASEEV